MNFLTELAFYLYRNQKGQISQEEFSRSFLKQYKQTYTLPIKTELLMTRLADIVVKDSFNNYSFQYPYLSYFFVAKHLAEHAEDSEIEQKVINNLHVDENAYIAVFMAHHSKNIKILNDIEIAAQSLFTKYQPARLSRAEMHFFDEQSDVIIKASLPPPSSTPEKERIERLKWEDGLEEEGNSGAENVESDGVEGDAFEIELRRAIKTVEVMGSILKNRVGSLEKPHLVTIFKEGVNVNLRILSSFFEAIQNKDDQEYIVDIITTKLDKVIEQRGEKITKEELQKIAQATFWNLNFLVLLGLISKIVHSLGSDKLTEIVEKSCNELNTPASFLVKHGMLMWYNKNVRIDEISKKIEDGDLSSIAVRVLKLMVADYCLLHAVSYKDKQRIENKLGIPSATFAGR